jgi:hypothetical protein
MSNYNFGHETAVYYCVICITGLFFEETVRELENKRPIKYFMGLRVDKYNFEITESKLYIQRYSNGIDALLESFPLKAAAPALL